MNFSTILDDFGKSYKHQKVSLFSINYCTITHTFKKIRGKDEKLSVQ